MSEKCELRVIRSHDRRSERAHSLHPAGAIMVATSRHSGYYRFTVHYAESRSLCRILDLLARAGAEPAWLFTRVQSDRFKLEIRVGGLCESRATALAARVNAVVNVLKVDWKFI